MSLELPTNNSIARECVAVKETVGKAKAAQEEAVAEKEAAEESVRKIQAQLDEVYVGGERIK